MSAPSNPVESSSARFRIGVDIGGTFTDVVVVPESGGAIHAVKIPTTPDDPSRGFLDAMAKALLSYDITPDQIMFAVHGTTIATNTIIQGKGATAGLITTEGFSDVLEIAYQTRPSLYDVFYEKPKPLIPRYRCLGVPERVGADGTVLKTLDEAAVETAARRLIEAGAECIAVAFLHSYRNPSHERAAGAIIKRIAPGVPVVLSSEVCPEYREYPRTSTTVVNAVLRPKIGPYISRLEERLSSQGLKVGLHLMTSSGGIIAAASAKALPVQLVESGPAAGVIGAAFVADQLSQADVGDHILALDIGGTTAKVCMVDYGMPALADEFEVGAAARPTTTASRGQGYPVKTPTINLVEIGAGGGSIARIDRGGALTVGPESAGAEPGPACYARGGDRPTLTDANLVLGRLNPRFLLGGALPIDVDRARSAIAHDIADPLGLSVEEAARAIVDIANAKMIAALEFISVQRGIDPRDYTLVPSGGNGPLHAVEIAAALGVRTVIVPPTPGVNSALGLLATDVKHDFVRTVYRRTLAMSAEDLWGLLDEMVDAGHRLLELNGVGVERREFRHEAELCYVGQSYPLKVIIPDDRSSVIPAIDAVFRDSHQQKYGFASATEPTLMANLRVTALGRVDRPKLAGHHVSNGERLALKAHRTLHLVEPTTVPVYARDSLGVGASITGAAIVEQMDTTTLLSNRTHAVVDRSGSLVITIRD